MFSTLRSLSIVILIASITSGQEIDPRLCSEQGDPVTAAPFNLVDSFCIPSSVPLGTPGGTASIVADGIFPANAAGQLDVFVIWEPGQIASDPGESFEYSSSLSWTSTQSDTVYKEWVGNFVPEQPYAFLITDSSNPDLTPAELTLAESSGSVSDRQFTHDMFPDRPLGRYHIQITGLEPFEDVTFSKTATGVHVVPEPSSICSGLLSVIGIACLRRRRQNVPS